MPAAGTPQWWPVVSPQVAQAHDRRREQVAPQARGRGSPLQRNEMGGVATGPRRMQMPHNT